MKKAGTLLVVDDDSMMCYWITSILNNGRYQVIGEASNGEEAIALCTELKPDLVLLDINMPKIGGLQALEEIRKSSPATMVLMVSVEASKENYEEATRKGAAGFVVKPFDAARLLEKIDSCFRERELH
jgi:two-component system, chemotaxis family, chemotaxis protein CheY